MLYRRYEGDDYKVLSHDALMENDSAPVVVYQSVRNGQVWVRPYYDFHAKFTPIRHPLDAIPPGHDPREG